MEPQQDIKSVSSLQKSTTSLLNEKEADVVYNNQIRSSKMLARIKRKKWVDHRCHWFINNLLFTEVYKVEIL